MPGEIKPAVTPEEHLGLVHLCARRFQIAAPLEYDDLFQAGCLGLVKAAARFQPERGLQFSTYAVPVILGEMRAVFRSGGAVHVSRGLRDLGRRAQAAELTLQETLGRVPTVAELSLHLGEPPERIAQALEARTAPMSLSAGEEGEELCIPVAAPEEKITEHISLQAALHALPPQDRQLIAYRYYQHKTQTETATLLSMTQVQVSRREKKILLALREKMA